MPVVERIDWLVRQLESGRKRHLSIGEDLDSNILKAAVVLDPAHNGGISLVVLQAMRSHLGVFRHMACHNVAVDRGHFHKSSGRTVVSIWVSLVPRNDNALPRRIDDDDDGNDHGQDPHGRKSN